MWPNARLTKLFGIEHPIVLAPMAGAMDFELVAAVSAAGGLGSLPCAMLTPDALRDQLAKVRARTDRPVNVNFFCHTPPVPNNAREARWRDQLKPYYEELGIDPALPVPSSNRMPFDAAFKEESYRDASVRADLEKLRELPGVKDVTNLYLTPWQGGWANMKIARLLDTRMSFSFEVFPPKTDAGIANLRE